MKLEPLTPEWCETARHWRALVPETLRTVRSQTAEEQVKFYESVVANPDSQHLYWGVTRGGALAGMVGLTYISWVNGNAEISLIVNPEMGRQGVGSQAVAAVLGHAFSLLRLLTIFGEAYESNPGVAFWRAMVFRYHGSATTLPRRKWWDGRLFDSLYFTFTKEAWEGTRHVVQDR